MRSFLIGLILFLGVSCLREYNILTKTHAFVFSLRSETAIGFIRGKEAALFRGFESEISGTDSQFEAESIPYELRDFFLSEKLNPVFLSWNSLNENKTLPAEEKENSHLLYREIHSPGMDAVYTSFNGKTMLIISRLEKEIQNILPPFEINIIVFCNNPRINISKVIKHFNCDQIIADGSNHNWFLEQVREKSSNLNIAFYSTSFQGFFSF